MSIQEIFAKRLKSARLLAGLSMHALSEKIEKRVSHNAISKYEKGQMAPNSEVLIALSKALEVKPDYFFRPFSYEIEQIEFRKKDRLGMKEIASIKEKVRDIVERYLELEDYLNIKSSFNNPVGETLISDGEAVESIVDQLRENWQIGLNAIPNVVELLEDKEIKVIELEGPQEFDGLSGRINGQFPVVVINRQYDQVRKRFTALHELGHLLLNFAPDLEKKERERLCHRFAGAMLIPRETFSREIGHTRNSISIAELIPVKEEYGISIQAIMRRAFDLGVISEYNYRQFCIRISRNKEERGLGSFIGKEHSDRFKQLVYRAASEEIISLSKAANLSNLKLAEFRRNFLRP